MLFTTDAAGGGGGGSAGANAVSMLPSKARAQVARGGAVNTTLDGDTGCAGTHKPITKQEGQYSCLAHPGGPARAASARRGWRASQAGAGSSAWRQWRTPSCPCPSAKGEWPEGAARWRGMRQGAYNAGWPSYARTTPATAQPTSLQPQVTKAAHLQCDPAGAAAGAHPLLRLDLRGGQPDLAQHGRHVAVQLRLLREVILHPQVPRRAALRLLLAQHVRQGAALVGAQLWQGWVTRAAQVRGTKHAACAPGSGAGRGVAVEKIRWSEDVHTSMPTIPWR